MYEAEKWILKEHIRKNKLTRETLVAYMKVTESGYCDESLYKTVVTNMYEDLQWMLDSMVKRLLDDCFVELNLPQSEPEYSSMTSEDVEQFIYNSKVPPMMRRND